MMQSLYMSSESSFFISNFSEEVAILLLTSHMEPLLKKSVEKNQTVHADNFSFFFSSLSENGIYILLLINLDHFFKRKYASEWAQFE